MRTIYNMNLLNVECPQNITERDCPLRKYLNSPESALRISINETLLMPKTDNLEELVKTIKQMRNICYNCQIDNKKQK